METYYSQPEIDTNSSFNNYKSIKITDSSLIKIATLSLFLSVSPVPVEAYNYATSNTENANKYNSENCDSWIDVPDENITLGIQQNSEQIKQNEIKTKFTKSYLENDLATDERTLYTNVFSFLADKLKVLPVKEEHVTVNRIDDTVTFYTYLGKKMLLSVSKGVSDIKDKEVMFSISLNRKVVLIDQMNIDELIESVRKSLQEIN